MPPVAFILQRALRQLTGGRHVPNDAPVILGRDDKPRIGGKNETREEREEFSASVVRDALIRVAEMPKPSPAACKGDPISDGVTRNVWASSMARKQGWI